jgi:tetratricopeptide (TPR) repeat protein
MDGEEKRRTYLEAFWASRVAKTPEEFERIAAEYLAVGAFQDAPDLRAELLAEARRLRGVRRRRRTLAFLVLLGAAAAALLSFSVAAPYYRYLQGEEAFASGDYETALARFEKVGGSNYSSFSWMRDSWTKTREIYIIQAEKAFLEGYLKKSAELFAKAGDFKDARENLDRINKILESLTPASPDFHIGVATLSLSQAEDAYRAAEFLTEKYGDASSGGMIRRVTMPDNFMSEMETTISQIVGLSDDPLVKVIVVGDAIPGTAEAFRRVKEKRPDIIRLAGEPQEDPRVIGPVADMAIYVDNIARGYLIINTAKELGAKKFVHISFPRHMGYELLARRRAIMEEACRELGLEFHFETAPDPTSEVGVSGAQRFILEQFPSWIEKYGKDTAFFCTNDAQTEPLLVQVAKYGAIFVEPDLPSPLMGYPGAFGIDLKEEAGDWPAILKKVESAVDKAGGSERMGTWAYSYWWSSVCALAEYGKNIVEGKAKLGDYNDLWAAYDVCTPGAQWNGSPYTDISSGTVMRNLLLVYQDTYVFGKGYMGAAKVEIPEKYLTNIPPR